MSIFDVKNFLGFISGRSSIGPAGMSNTIQDESVSELFKEKVLSPDASDIRDSSEEEDAGWNMWDVWTYDTEDATPDLVNSPIAKALLAVDSVRTVINTTLFGNKDYTLLKKEEMARLDALTHDCLFSETLELVMPKISKFIISELKKKEYKNYILHEKERVVSIIDFIIFRVVGNFAEHTIKKLNNEKKIIPTNIIPELLKELTQIVFKDFSTKLTRYNEIDALPATTELALREKKKQFRELFIPLTEKLLAIGFPNGKKDLETEGTILKIPVKVVSSGIWNALSQEVIPDLLTVIFRFTQKPSHHTEPDLEILNKPGGSLFLKFSKFVGNLGQDAIPDILKATSPDISESLFRLLFKNEEYKKNSDWFAEILKGFFTGTDSASLTILSEIGKIAGLNIESLCIHAFASLSKDIPDVDNLIPYVGNKLFGIFNDFFTPTNRSLLDTEIEKFKEERKNGSITENDFRKKCSVLFTPLAENILEAAGLKNENETFNLYEPLLRTVLREFYTEGNAFLSDTAKVKEQMAETLFDPDPINATVDKVKVLKDPEGERKRAIENSGTNTVVEDLSTSLGLVGDDLIDFSKNFSLTNEKLIIKSIEDSMFEEEPFTDPEREQCAAGIGLLMNSENPGITALWKYLQATTNSFLLKLCLQIVENNPGNPQEDAKENKNIVIPSVIFHRIFCIVNEYLAPINKEIEIIHKASPEENLSVAEKKEQRKKIYKLFEKPVAELLKIGGEDIESIFPVPNFLKKSLKEKLIDLFLPALFYKAHTLLNVYTVSAPEAEKILEQNLETQAGKKIGDSITGYIPDFIPSFIKKNSSTVVKVMQTTGEKYLKFSDENKTAAVNILNKNIQLIADDKANSGVVKEIGNISRGVTLKVLSGLTNYIKKNETEQEKLLLDTGIGVIQIVSDYIHTLTTLSEHLKGIEVYVIPHKTVLEWFQKKGQLHSALKKDLDPNATPKEKEEQRFNELFLPLTEHLLACSGINKEKDILLDKTTFAKFLMQGSEVYKRPEEINELVFKMINACCDGVDNFAKELEHEPPMEESSNEQQKNLNIVLGKLVLSIVDLIPEFWLRSILKLEKIKTMSVESLGLFVRKKIDEKTINQYIGTIFSDFCLENSNLNKLTPKQLKRHYKKRELLLIHKLTDVGSRRLQDTFKSFLKEKWVNLQDTLDEKCEGIGTAATAIKKFLDKIFRFIFFVVLKPVIKIMVFTVAWFFVKLIIAKKSKEAIKNLHMPIQENLLFNIADAWMKKMPEQTNLEKYNLRTKSEEEAAQAAKSESEIAEPEPVLPEPAEPAPEEIPIEKPEPAQPEPEIVKPAPEPAIVKKKTLSPAKSPGKMKSPADPALWSRILNFMIPN